MRPLSIVAAPGLVALTSAALADVELPLPMTVFHQLDAREP